MFAFLHTLTEIKRGAEKGTPSISCVALKTDVDDI